MGILLLRGETSASPEMEKKNYIFDLILAKELLKALSNTILAYFLEFFFFLSSSRVFSF